jgi:hypothetical protein
MLSTFLEFLIKLAAHLGIKISIDDLKKNVSDESELAAHVLDEINKYFYQQHKNLDKKYISEFHKYWEKEHEHILNPEIDKQACTQVARALEIIYKNRKCAILYCYPRFQD